MDLQRGKPGPLLTGLSVWLLLFFSWMNLARPTDLSGIGFLCPTGRRMMGVEEASSGRDLNPIVKVVRG